MASLGTRFLLFLVLVFFIASVCEGRGGRGGGRGRSGGSRYRYRYRSSRGGSYSGSGSGNAGTIVGIIFGVIGGIIFLVVAVFLCKAFCCSDSSSGSAKYSNSRGMVLSNPAHTPYTITTTTTTNNGFASSDTTTSSYTQGKTSFTPTDHIVSPPSYKSVVSPSNGDLPYTSQPAGDLSYNSFPPNPPPASEFSSPSAYGTPYPPAPSEPSSNNKAEGGNDASGASAPIGFV